MPEPSRWARRRVNWPLMLIGLFKLPVGVQAALLPRSFFEDFPLGRGWVAATGGPYDEHLVRDVGVLFVALIVATAWTAWTRAGDRAVATAWIVQGAGHLAFHSAHLMHLSGSDQAGLLVSLIVVVVLAVAAVFYPMARSASS
ncbi:MAG: hypothetical protein JWN39_542 [Ilumatobacteraceae bacterium]|nr:hypothetical protein [Ilumatobacteraceae bacterium]